MIMTRSFGALVTFGWLLAVTYAKINHMDKAAASLKRIANVSYAAGTSNQGEITSLFSPRMDFDQWKPLTGRGDPLRNDPTYDYEPPVLKKVHYWAEDSRLELKHYPERKSEVLMLGVSSRRPSVATRHPPSPPMRQRRPSLPKYEDFTYKLSEKYPMTILVPPPIPPKGHKPTLFVLSGDTNVKTKETDTTHAITSPTTVESDYVTTSLYALQEANLIYQSSTSNIDYNQTKAGAATAVSSDYAGWGPTTPMNDPDGTNDTYNLVIHENYAITNNPYTFYKPMFSEAPPPITPNPIITFLPTILPPLQNASVTVRFPSQTEDEVQPTTEVTTEPQVNSFETSTEQKNNEEIMTSLYNALNSQKQYKDTMLNMLTPMMTMPLVDGPERPEDHLYAHASENVHVFQETENPISLETMQTMQPPPPKKTTESLVISLNNKPVHVNSFTNIISQRKPGLQTLDPYLHLRHTTPQPVKTTNTNDLNYHKPTTEIATIPMYLIIQGHSKVKTYGSKSKTSNDIEQENSSNKNSKHNESSQVRHLHVAKDRYPKNSEITDIRRASRAHNLKALVTDGLGSIEIQEADVGIKYDVSDGSNVPVEVYRKGFVESDENDYSSSIKKNTIQTRSKRQLEQIIPIDEDTLEEYVYNFLKKKRNEKGITGLIAQAVTSEALDDIDDDDDDEEDDEDEER